MGNLDRILRVMVSVLLVILYLTHVLDGIVGIVALVASGIFILTSLVSVCPLYTLLGLSTCKTK